MLLGDDVIDRKRVKGIVILMDVAVFTTIAGACSDVTAECIVHQPVDRSCKTFRAFD